MVFRILAVCPNTGELVPTDVTSDTEQLAPGTYGTYNCSKCGKPHTYSAENAKGYPSTG